jgi:hypothetical protein
LGSRCPRRKERTDAPRLGFGLDSPPVEGRVGRGGIPSRPSGGEPRGIYPRGLARRPRVLTEAQRKEADPNGAGFFVK